MKKQSLNLQLLFNNITREKWQFIRVTQYRRKAGSILHRYPEQDPLLSLTPLSSSRRILHQHEAKLHNSVCFSRTRRSSMQFWAFYQPYSLPCQERISGFKHQSVLKAIITTRMKALKRYATKQPLLLLCICSFFPRSLLTIQKLGKQNKPPQITFGHPPLSSWHPSMTLQNNNWITSLPLRRKHFL